MPRISSRGPAVTTVNQNLDVKASVRVVTNAALPAYTRTANVITANANGALAAVDSVTLVAGDRLLLKDGAAGADNGIYAVTTLGTASVPFVLTRTTDADASAKVTTGMFTFVEEGTVWASTGWILTTANPITLNTTALTFAQFTGAGEIIAGTGIAKSGNTVSLAAAADGTIKGNASGGSAAPIDLTGLPLAVATSKAYDGRATLPVTLFTNAITVLTAGAPADVATITVPAGMTRYHATSPSGATATSLIVAETASGTLASATFAVFTGAGGTGSAMSSSGGVAAPAAANAATALSADDSRTLATASTLYVRQITNSANAGTVRLFLTLHPIPAV